MEQMSGPPAVHRVSVCSRWPVSAVLESVSVEKSLHPVVPVVELAANPLGAVFVHIDGGD